MSHLFALKDFDPGSMYVIESCPCGARRKRTRGGTIQWEQADGHFSGKKTPCLGAYSTPVLPQPATLRREPPLIEAIAIIRLLIEDRPRGEICAKNFLTAYA